MERTIIVHPDRRQAAWPESKELAKKILLQFVVDNAQDLLTKRCYLRFKANAAADHKWLTEHGYTIESYPDCTYGIRELPGITPADQSCTGYAIWPTEHADVLRHMLEDGVIELTKFEPANITLR